MLMQIRIIKANEFDRIIRLVSVELPDGDVSSANIKMKASLRKNITAIAKISHER